MPLEAKDIFEANSKSIRELLSERGLGLYIPPYQRPYGWDKEKVNKLVEDTLHGLGELIKSDESFTFLGTVITIHDRDYKTVQPIVRQEVPAKVLTVIDGQQRLTTLLLWNIVLHNQIAVGRAKLLRGKNRENLSAADLWLDQQSDRLLSELKPTFVEEYSFGDARQYPRMIRSFDDQWSRNVANARYQSPVAHLVAAYAAHTNGEFRPDKRAGRIEGEDALIGRFNQIRRLVKDLLACKQSEELEEIPPLPEMIRNVKFQEALLNHQIPAEVEQHLASQPPVEYAGLFKLILLACYVLSRVAVTVVRGKNEDYAFTVFESLNTTGEPLTAFETFKPRVVAAEGLERYESSVARQHMVQVSDYLAEFKPGDPLQDATRDLLLYFANAETGEKLSKRLADQRRYLKDEFERYEGDEQKRLAFIQNLRDTVFFLQHSWAPKHGQPSLYELPVNCTTDAVRLCLRFLGDLGHSVVIGPLVRFYSAAMQAASAEEKIARAATFEQALLAITAFSVLWRASRRGTANIDQEYREIMQGSNSVTQLPPLARSVAARREHEVPAPQLDLPRLKEELRERLIHHGKVADKNTWVNDAAQIPSYSNSAPVSRFLLLAAYHDAVPDPAAPGLIKAGRNAVAPCLTYNGWISDVHLSLEHIAPQDPTPDWDAAVYANKETVHRLGNLVLVQMAANASLGNRPFAEKRVLYSALGAASREDAKRILDDASANGINFAQSTQELVDLSTHMAHLEAVGNFPGPWSVDFIDARSRRLLELAWDRLYAWLS